MCNQTLNGEGEKIRHRVIFKYNNKILEGDLFNNEVILVNNSVYRDFKIVEYLEDRKKNDNA